MVAYRLEHLKQDESQSDAGPIQDDEALLLFALIRVMRLRRVLELGSLYGYNVRNMCEAVGPEGRVYGVDLNECQKVADNHVPIQKDVGALTAEDIDNEPVEFVFFDCHAYEASHAAYGTLTRAGIINDKTLLGLHDTNLWAYPIGDCYAVEGGFLFSPTERQLANDFKLMGYDVLSFGTKPEVHSADFPYRCGITLLQKYRPFHDLMYGPRAPWMTNEATFAERYERVGTFDYRLKDG